ncbi:DUF6069 family protein [Micromonospora craterilacus]|uniref:DUF6069 family protein n=1 Tax=Micromonospora craterilacus TaxID=1655439 RepID=UPI002279DB41|nr:DUF6069 family protein [Micromonospora craterilacus]
MRPSRGTPAAGRRSSLAVVAATVGAALIMNLLIHAVGRAAGGRFVFTNAGQSMQVDALTVGGFTVVPLLLGLTAVALTARRWPWTVIVGSVVAPLLALVTIPIMTIPAGFDTVSAVALSLCHVSLAPISVLGLLSLPRGTRVSGEDTAAGDAPASNRTVSTGGNA